MVPEMAQNNRAWTHKIDDRIGLIADGLRQHEHLQNKLPGLKPLLEDYLDTNNAIGTDDDQEGFHRRLLQVFRDSEADSAYEHWLAKLAPQEKERVSKFVDGHSLDKAGDGYTPGPSIGVREHVELMLKAGTGPVVVEGLNDRGHGVKEGPFLWRMIEDLADVFTHAGRDSIVVSRSLMKVLLLEVHVRIDIDPFQRYIEMQSSRIGAVSSNIFHDTHVFPAPRKTYNTSFLSPKQKTWQ